MQSTVSSVLVTQQHVISCDIDTHGLRLLEILCDRSSTYVALTNTKVVRRSDQEVVFESESAVINKSNIGLAFPNYSSHEAPARRLHNFAKKRCFEVFLLVYGYEVTGEIHLHTMADATTVLARDTSDFLPIDRHGRMLLRFSNIGFDQTSYSNRCRPG